MKRVLITGSTGFIGRNLIKKISKEFQILEVTRSIEKSLELFADTTQKLLVSDECFKEKVTEFKPEIVVHLAAYLTASDDWNDVEKLLNSNIVFTAKILDAVATLPIKLFINTGTFAEYYSGNNNLLPAYFYAATKTASRSFVNYYANAYNFKQATVIPYTIYGGLDSQKKIIDLIFESINTKEPLQLSPGEQVLDFIHVDDVVDFYKTLLTNVEKLPNAIEFKLGTGKGTTLKEIASLIEEITSKKTNINWGGKSYRKSDVMFAVANNKSCKNILDWKPKIKLVDGLKRMLNVC